MGIERWTFAFGKEGKQLNTVRCNSYYDRGNTLSFKIPQIFEMTENTSKEIQYKFSNFRRWREVARWDWQGDKQRLVYLILSAIFNGFKKGIHEIRFTVVREIALCKLNNRTPVLRWIMVMAMGYSADSRDGVK